MYFASHPKDKGRVNPIGMHFYGVIGHNNHMWTLMYGDNFGCKPLKRDNFTLKYFRYRIQGGSR